MKNELYKKALVFVEENITYLSGQIKIIDDVLQSVKDEEHLTSRDIAVFRKMVLAYKVFNYSNGSFNDLQMEVIFKSASLIDKNIPSISSSSIGRYLIDEKLKRFISDDEYNKVLQMRKENKENGNRLGGYNSIKVKTERVS